MYHIRVVFAPFLRHESNTRAGSRLKRAYQKLVRNRSHNCTRLNKYDSRVLVSLIMFFDD